MTMLLEHTVCCLVILVQFILTFAKGASEFEFHVSQQGIDEITKFSAKTAFDTLKSYQPTIHLKTKEKPYLRPLGRVGLKNEYLLKDIRIILEKDTLGLLVQDLRVNSEVNLTAELWPIPVNEEYLNVNFTLGHTYLGVATQDSDLYSSSNKFHLKTCTVTHPKISAEAKHYWLIDSGLKLGSKWLRGNLPSFLCSIIAGMVNMVRDQLSSSVQLAQLIDTQALPEELREVSLRYNLVSLKIDDGELAAEMALNWESPSVRSESTDKSVTDSEEGNDTNVAVEVTEGNGHHLTLWVDESVVNDFLKLMKWDFLWMEDKVPVNDTKIPSDSAKFLSTLCPHCYFELKVWNNGPPRLESLNNSLELFSWQRIKLWVVNPHIDQTSTFVSFFALFHAEVVPFIHNRHLKARVDLLGVKVNMTKSAFPDSWNFFVKDLVQDMIHGMVWPGVRDSLQKFTEETGFLLPETCGFDPKSAEIVMSFQKFGIVSDLRLTNLDLDTCFNEIDKNIPKELPSLGGSIG